MRESHALSDSDEDGVAISGELADVLLRNLLRGVRLVRSSNGVHASPWAASFMTGLRSVATHHPSSAELLSSQMLVGLRRSLPESPWASMRVNVQSQHARLIASVYVRRMCLVAGRDW